MTAHYSCCRSIGHISSAKALLFDFAYFYSRGFDWEMITPDTEVYHDLN